MWQDKGPKLLTITSEGMNFRTLLRAATLTLTLLHADLIWALKDRELSMVRPRNFAS